MGKLRHVSPVNLREINRHLIVFRDVPSVSDSSCLEHDFRSHSFRFGIVLVREEYNLFDAALYDDFGAFVAREQAHVDFAPLDVGRVFVEDCVHFGVADVHELTLESVNGFAPGEEVVLTADGHSIVAHTDDLVLLVHDTGAHLNIRCEMMYLKKSQDREACYNFFFGIAHYYSQFYTFYIL